MPGQAGRKSPPRDQPVVSSRRTLGREQGGGLSSELLGELQPLFGDLGLRARAPSRWATEDSDTCHCFRERTRAAENEDDHGCDTNQKEAPGQLGQRQSSPGPTSPSGHQAQAGATALLRAHKNVLISFNIREKREHRLRLERMF